MKITLNEFEGCFSFECEAETVADGSLLARLGLQAQHTDTNFLKDKIVSSTVLRKPAKRKRNSVWRSR